MAAPVTFLAIGSRGDVEPMAVLAGAVAARGRPATVVAVDEYAALVRAHGAAFRGLGPAMDEVARLGAQITIFRLGSDPGLARFIDQVARRVEGRVVVPELDGLGAAVVGDYLRSRRRRR